MDSDVIRHEIDKTARRIHERMEILVERSHRAKRTVSVWAAFSLTAAGALAAILLRRGHLRHSPVRGRARTVPVGAPRRTDMRAAR